MFNISYEQRKCLREMKPFNQRCCEIGEKFDLLFVFVFFFCFFRLNKLLGNESVNLTV